jgi:hypothetical protein
MPLSNPGSNVIGGSNVYTVLGANQTLASNTNYFAGISGLSCSLPSAPLIGQVVTVATGNYPFIVLHGNPSQSILNLSTLTLTGIDRGIYLKEYSCIQLMYMGNNLWVSQYRTRTINNWANPVISANITLNSYTPTFYGTPPVIAFGVLNALPNGDLTSFDYFTQNLLLATATDAYFLITFQNAIQITSFDIYVGQANILAGTGISNWGVTTVNIYQGSDLSNLVQTLTPVGNFGLNKVKQSFNTPNITATSATYIFRLQTTYATVGLCRLDIFGKTISGGEILV